MTWQENAACAGAEPTLFDPLEMHPNAVWPVIEATAHRYCSTCPVMAQCAALADEQRLWGIYAGTYRRVQHGRYKVRVIATDAVEPQLTDRRHGTRNGGTAA